MPEVTIRERQLTPRTLVHDVMLNGKPVASSARRANAEKLVPLIEQNPSAEAWNALPWKTRLNFVFAFNQDRPNF